MDVGKFFFRAVVAVGMATGIVLCQNSKKEQKEVVTENMKDKIEYPLCESSASTDTIYCPRDTFWCKLTPEEAEYTRRIMRNDAAWGDTIRPISVDAAKKAYAAAKEAAKHIR